jgi:hypothetical protein
MSYINKQKTNLLKSVLKWVFKPRCSSQLIYKKTKLNSLKPTSV